MSRVEVASACRISLVECMGLRAGEKVAVITDEPCRDRPILRDGILVI